MAIQPVDFPHLKAKIVSVKGTCHAGHQAGDTLALGCWDTGGLCGFFYHDIFPYLSTLQFGGKYPWEKDGLTLECPDAANRVTIHLTRPAQ